MKRIVITLFLLLFLKCNVIAQEKITKENVANAEKILGLEFTEAERDSMLDALNEQLNNYMNIRKIKIDNSIPPAILFNPIPVGVKIDNNQKPIHYSDYSYAKLPENFDDLAFYSIGELAYLIKTRKITSTQLTKFFLERLKKYGPKLYSVVNLTEERALEEAKKADEEIAKGKYRGLLHGIPYGVKDLLTTKKYPTTWGAEPYQNQIIDEDATVIKKLHNAGAVLVAKLSMGALAWGDVWFGGTTRNPWDTTKGSSGSSAGSAASVSAGLIPFAIGTETWGSIVSPSTVCGVTGLRPTYGRVSRTGAMALSWSMDKIGVICRYAEDLAIVFDAIRGSDGIDQTLYDASFNYKPEINLKKLKIGYLKSDFDSDYPFHKNDSLALRKLKELGVELIPIELPYISTEDLAFILSAEAAAAFDELTRSNQDDLLKRQIKNAWPNVFRAARFIPAVEYINANRIRYMLIQEMKKIFDKVDVYISPSWKGNNLLTTNLTGHPCVVVPNGFSKNGTPTSFTFIGNLFDEAKLISLAKAFQSVTDFHKYHPSEFK
ncbi:MAG: amidase [Melioribacter sp.]|uniref:amidase n=1 Tax=Rosettibacter primus TaxID=3111523 RepID=UPI00247D33C1|nr:amidase [Melioribacter sp.]